MKYLLLFICVLRINIACANRVDKLTTDKQVAAFLLTIGATAPIKGGAFTVDNSMQIRHYRPCGGFAKKWQIKNWEKVDFNNDGKTDLFAYGHLGDYIIYAAIDNGDDTFKLIEVENNNFYEATIAKPVIKHKQTLLLFCGKNTDSNFIEKWRPDTLIYKYGSFIEYNPRPAHYQFESLSYRRFGGVVAHAPGESFLMSDSLSINMSNATAAHYLVYSQQSPIIYQRKLTSAEQAKLSGLLNYLAVKQLADNWSSGAMDAGKNVLTIRFKDGTQKIITDYGGGGWFSLAYLESTLNLISERLVNQ